MAVSPKTLANLKPAQKGEVRNPSGNNGSEDRYLTGLIRKTAKEIAPGQERLPQEQRKTRGELFVESLWDDVLSKRPSEIARRIITERSDGRLPLALTGEDGGPVLFSESPLKSLSDTELDERIRALEEQKVGKLPNGKKKNGKSNGST